MKIKTVLFGLLALAFVSCKKNYNCECRNANGTYAAGETYGTKKKAEDKCSSLSAGDTKCYVK